MERYIHSIQKSHRAHLLSEAEELLSRAQRENLNFAEGVPENNQIEAVINFALVRVKIRQGDRNRAEEYLKAGSKQLPVIESDGVKRLYEHAKQEITNAVLNFSVVNGLDMDKNKESLEVFILQHAIAEARSLGSEPWDVINKSRATFFNLLNKHNLKCKR